MRSASLPAISSATVPKRVSVPSILARGTGLPYRKTLRRLHSATMLPRLLHLDQCPISVDASEGARVLDTFRTDSGLNIGGTNTTGRVGT